MTNQEIKNFWDKIDTEISENKYNDKKELYDLDLRKYSFADISFPSSIESTNPFINLDSKISIIFKDCRFSGKVDFSSLYKAKNISFQNCHFYEDVELINQDIKNIFLFENCTVYKNIKFQNVNFFKLSSFIKTTFKGKLDFIHTKFYSNALFNECKINNIELDNTFFMDEASFLDIKNKNGKKLESESIGSRETARIIKHSFEKQDNIIEANKFYTLEMKKREKELSFIKNPFEWLVFKIHGISSNHSQDWMLALFWIINITFLYSVIDYKINCENSFFIFMPYINLCLEIFIVYKLKFQKIWLFILTILHYFIYVEIINKWNLYLFSNSFNPFLYNDNRKNYFFNTYV